MKRRSAIYNNFEKSVMAMVRAREDILSYSLAVFRRMSVSSKELKRTGLIPFEKKTFAYSSFLTSTDNEFLNRISGSFSRRAERKAPPLKYEL